MKNILHSLLLPAALLLSGASAYIPARSTSPAAGTAPGPSLGVRDDASVAFRAPRSIPPTGLRPWVPPAHEAAGGHGPLGITSGLQDTLTGTVTGYTVYHHVTDHLGSVRAVVYAGGTAPSAQQGISPGTVVETSDFLPFERIDTIYISDSQYNVVKKEGCGLFIQITDKTLLERLSVATSPILAILIDGSIIIARGNVITSSFIPDGVDCFYPVNSSGKLLLLNRDNIIPLLYVSKKHPQSILRKRRFREESWDHN